MKVKENYFVVVNSILKQFTQYSFCYQTNAWTHLCQKVKSSLVYLCHFSVEQFEGFKCKFEKKFCDFFTIFR